MRSNIAPRNKDLGIVLLLPARERFAPWIRAAWSISEKAGMVMTRFGLLSLTILTAHLMIGCASQTVNIAPPNTLQVTTSNLVSGQVQVAYSATLGASGGTRPYSWSRASGSLPTGLSLNASTGAISGTPSSAASSSFTVQVKDSAATPQTATSTLTLTVVAPPLVVSTSSLPQGTAGQSYAASLQATGGTPGYTWRVTSGSLPPGLSLMASGQITGTPSATGTFNFTVKVTDAAAQPQTATQALSLTVSSSPTLDQYGGLAAAPCVKGAQGLFYVEKGSNSRWHFCTPDGNVFFMQAVYRVGLYNPTAALPKYGDSDTYRQQTVLRLKSWNFNAMAIYWHVGMMPISWDNQTPNPKKMPFVHIFRMASRASRNRDGVGTAPIKQLNNFSCTSPPPPHVSCNHALNPFGFYWDVYDPAFTTYATNMAKTTFQTQGTYPADFPSSWATGKQWVIGFVPDDSDYLTGLSGPGPEYPGRDGGRHPHVGHVIATASPVQTNNGDLAFAGCTPAGSCSPYATNVVFSKNAWRDYLIGKYITVAALNTAWGSNYTTFNVDLGYPAATTGSHGVLDEDGSHAWIGTDVIAQAGANANVKIDLDAFLQLFAAQYYNTVATAIRTANPGMLVFSNAPMNSHAGMTRRPVLRAAGAALDVIEVQHDPTRLVIAQETFKETGKPMVTWTGMVAPNDSAAAGTPDAYLIYPSQAARGTAYADEMSSKLALQAYDGSFPYIGTNFWAWLDGAENANWGLVTALDNAYDGKEAVVPTSRDPWGHRIGGEKANYNDFISRVRTANLAALQTLLAHFKPQ